MKNALSTFLFLFISSIGMANGVEDSLVSTTDSSSLDLAKLEHIEGSCLGTQYKWGGESMEGFDCSGFVRFVFKQLGIELPHSSKAISKMGKQIPLNEAKKGDLIIFTGHKDRAHVGHLGIVMDNEPDCLIFTHSSSAPKNNGVVRTNYYDSNYPNRFIKIIRLK
ncbi:MAG: C40 family peptidase [Crocinitomicaceae bacterium]|nr:C40 family peptidase [Crocinitomicaceae bacterium]